MAGTEIVMVGMENVMATESGTTSSCVTVESRDTCIPIESNNTSETRIDSLREAKENVMNQSQTVTPKIQKVPSFLRGGSNFVEQYEPRMVSLGPIHHRNPKYKSGVGYDYKQELINDFVQASGQGLDFLKQQIENIQQLRDCFKEEVTEGYGDRVLASMLCEDGCAILQCIYSLQNQNMSHDIAQDILLLENQIPYIVLKELMRLSKNRDQLKESIATFIEKSVMVRPDEESKKKAAKGNRGDNLPSQANPQRDVQIEGDHVHLLDLLRISLLGKSQAKTPNERRDSKSYPKVQELKAAGICLRQSSGWFLRNIVFSRRFPFLGSLCLPPITVDDSTRSKLLNLVAYEMCFENDRGVMSYLFFLYSLINGDQDVKELRVANVLYYSFSDTQLQELLREICRGVPGDPDTYRGVKKQIQEYYGTLMSKMLQFYHAKIRDSNFPLAIVLAVLLDLYFSGTQTWIAFMTWISDKTGFSVSPASQSHS